MPKMYTDAQPVILTGPTMGTLWSVTLGLPLPEPTDVLTRALQNIVDMVDRQMSTWRDDSDLMRLNAAPCDAWIDLPGPLMTVLAAGLEISRATDGAFEMNVGDAVRAWGFGAQAIDITAIHSARAAPRLRASETLVLDLASGRACKSAPLALDLCGIAKGYGVDQLVEVLRQHGVKSALCAIDGELRALGFRADGSPWSIAIETPDRADHQAQHVVALADGALATSGDYRHFVTVKGQRLSHTIDPKRGAPLIAAPASVSVRAQSCMIADAMATALMVMGRDAGLAFARKAEINAFFMTRSADDGAIIRDDAVQNALP